MLDVLSESLAKQLPVRHLPAVINQSEMPGTANNYFAEMNYFALPEGFNTARMVTN